MTAALADTAHLAACALKYLARGNHLLQCIAGPALTYRLSDDRRAAR